MKSIAHATYYDKVLGGWIGKRAGGLLGGPLTGHKRCNTSEASQDVLTKRHADAGLALQLLWLDLVKQKGPFVRESDFGEHWKKHARMSSREYGVAARNLKLGVYPPDSGMHNNAYWGAGMGSPIRSEIWGMLNPGMPAQAAFYAGMDSSVDHDGFSIDAERFLSALAALAFFASDLPRMIDEAASLFEHQSPFTDLLDYVRELHETSAYDIAVHKMKSMYGDANLANAPMNVGFILLTLLFHEPHFDNLIKAVRLGHASDCIAATVGALYGIINGASHIDARWRDLIGEELPVNPEIVYIRHASTLSGLAEQTCRAGMTFIDYFAMTKVIDPAFRAYEPSPPRFSVNTLLVDYKASMIVDEQDMEIEYENLTDKSQHVTLALASGDLEFRTAKLGFSVDAMKMKSQKSTFILSQAGYDELVGPDPKTIKSSFVYDIQVWLDGELECTLHRGVPFYGTWLMFGPFIADDPELAAPDAGFPAHGRAPLPSPQYINHDRLDFETEHLTVEQARRIAKEQNFEEQPFKVQAINPDSFEMNLDDYFDGRGERTLYLYSKVFAPEAKDVWLVMGCSVNLKVCCNGSVIAGRRKIRRSWPCDIIAKAELQAGENDIFIRIDSPLDEIRFSFGIKEFVGTPPHQSHWDVKLTPFV